MPRFAIGFVVLAVVLTALTLPVPALAQTTTTTTFDQPFTIQSPCVSSLVYGEMSGTTTLTTSISDSNRLNANYTVAATMVGVDDFNNTYSGALSIKDKLSVSLDGSSNAAFYSQTITIRMKSPTNGASFTAKGKIRFSYTGSGVLRTTFDDLTAVCR